MDPAGAPELQPFDRFAWERVVRRARMKPMTKYVALAMATYSDSNGSRVRPGINALALVLCISVPTVKRAFAELRELGLIQKTKQGNRWKNEADTYRLTVPMNLASLPMLDPDEVAEASETA
ncbi:helix-turn-helix domain-containing protein [Nocardia sp. CDC159]|uniref:Helix-turn-helix domain-containing protein n=1 Tax=Nocardia pulmonis TaxID=2951408 RepID=A0A9X2E8R4_9NOCA|nr:MULTISPECIES: helix-turn-helix domain-containing protein [Nocardia]MCM6774945.1 helix-turn-helix domain-containing protein [Nocardia pulmonis]MCM6789876.1 helix-turn-helix domain-containing protein [Nocardia sp. CDC159]